MTLTLPKLLLLAVVVWIVWRWLGRYGASSQSRRSQEPPKRNPGSAQRPIEDMVKCPKCGAYVPARGDHHCEV